MAKNQTSKELAVLISDIHVNYPSMPVSIPALQASVNYAEGHGLPLIIAGDLHDTKRHLDGVCVKALIDTISAAKCDVTIIEGNHDKINEKGKGHSLEFLRPYARIVDAPEVHDTGLHLLPYYHDTEELQYVLDHTPAGSTLIMHQGVLGAFMGEYAVDKSSIDPSALANFRCISGHYHRAQDIKCGRPQKGAVGLFSYIGSPYTISFAEAHDGPKGFQVLHDNGLLTQVPLRLRKHVKVERHVDQVMDEIPDLNPEDKLWLLVTGETSKLDKLKKKEIGMHHLGHEQFKLDRIYPDVVLAPVTEKRLTSDQVLDSLIEQSGDTDEQKAYLKTLWREVLDEAA